MNAMLNTPSPTVLPIITGHFHEKKGYANWREHGTEDWLLIYTLGGKGRFGHAGGEIIANPGDLMLLRPRTRHDYGVEASLRRWELLWAHFLPRPAWIEWLSWPEAAPGLLRLTLGPDETRQRIVKRFADVHRLATGAGPRRETFAMNALEEMLLWCDRVNPRADQRAFDPRVQRAMDYLCANLAATIPLPHLARHSGLSVSRLSHLFRQQVGTTPQQFLEQQRLTRAEQLLMLTGRSIKEIAYDVGFANPFYFTLRFKRHMALSPREYRRQRVRSQGSRYKMRR